MLVCSLREEKRPERPKSLQPRVSPLVYGVDVNRPEKAKAIP